MTMVGLHNTATRSAGVGGTYDRLTGAFLGATEPAKLTDGSVPANRYRYLTIDWFHAGSTLTAIKAVHPAAKVLAYQNLAGMRIGGHANNRPSSLVTFEDAQAHGAGADSWFLHTASVNITSSTNATPPVFTTAAAHGLTTSKYVEISGHTPAAYNGIRAVASVPTATTFTVSGLTAAGAGSGGTAATVAQFSGFPDLFAAHLGRTSWRLAARQHLAGILADGFHGMMLDDVNSTLGPFGTTLEYASDNPYRDAVAGAVVDLGGAVKGAGGILAGNVGADPWNADHRVGFTAMLAGLSVWNRESYHAWSSGTSATPFDGPSFAALQEMVAEAEAAGVASALEANPLTTPDHPRMIRYGLAAFYLEWPVVGDQTPTDSAYAYNNGEPLSAAGEYRNLIGTPVEAKQLVSGTSTDGAWMRHFIGGVVCINAKTTAGLVTFTLGGTYLDPSNASVTSVQLDRGHGMVLLKP